MVRFSLDTLAQDTAVCAVGTRSGVDHVFATADLGSGRSVRDQLWSTLRTVTEALDGFDAAESLLHLTVFHADPAQSAICRQIVREYFGKDVPATSYVPQAPCSGSPIAVEVLALGRGREKVQITRISDQVLLAEQDGRTWVYADQAVPLTSAQGVYDKTICTFQHLNRLLPRGGARMDQVLRTWIYLGDIVEDDGPVQRYKELNRARADIYEGVPFLEERLPEEVHGPVFPASTGIGTAGRGLSLSAVALLSDREDVVAVPLENPRQTPAFDYAANYSPQSPKFSRGMAVVEGPDTTLFISGTASITHSETQHEGDAVGQTHETLENIAELISERNLARHGLAGRGTTLQGLAVARVYIKHLTDYLAVRRVCEERLPGVPLTFVVADVCRTDLLVEIEGIALSSETGTQPGAARVRTCARRRAECRHVCPEACPERDRCPHAILH